MPKAGSWGNWAVIGGRHSREPGVDKFEPAYYEKSPEQQRQEASARLRKIKAPTSSMLSSSAKKKKNQIKKSPQNNPLQDRFSNIVWNRVYYPQSKTESYVSPKKGPSIERIDKLIKGDCNSIILQFRDGEKEYYCQQKGRENQYMYNPYCVGCPKYY